MVNNDHIAHRALVAREADHAAVRRVDRRTVGHGNINAPMVGGRAADAGVAVAEVGGDAAARRPAEAAGGIPARARLGALCALLGDRLGERDAGDDGALGLLTVDIGDVRHDVRRAVDTLREDLVVALVHGRVVGVGDVVLDILDVVLPLGDHNGQIRHGVGERQLIADLQAVDVEVGVDGQQLLGRHAMAVGDAAPGVALDDRVGHLTLLRGVEDLGDLAEVHDAFGRDVALDDADVLDKVNGQRILGDIALLELVEQALQRALILRRADQLAVDIEGVALCDKAHLVGQLLLQLGAVHDRAALDQAARVLNGAVGERKRFAQRLRGDVRDARRDALRLKLARHGVERLSLVNDGGAEGIARDKNSCRRDHQRRTAEGKRVILLSAPFCGAGRSAGAADMAAPRKTQLLASQRAPVGRKAAQQKQQLARHAVGLREIPLAGFVYRLTDLAVDRFELLPQRHLRAAGRSALRRPLRSDGSRLPGALRAPVGALLFLLRALDAHTLIQLPLPFALFHVHSASS